MEALNETGGMVLTSAQWKAADGQGALGQSCCAMLVCTRW